MQEGAADERGLALRGLLLSDSLSSPLRLGPEGPVVMNRTLTIRPESGTSHPDGAFRPGERNYLQMMKTPDMEDRWNIVQT